ncbi:unnamed protein product [Musa textilis]
MYICIYKGDIAQIFFFFSSRVTSPRGEKADFFFSCDVAPRGGDERYTERYTEIYRLVYSTVPYRANLEILVRYEISILTLKSLVSFGNVVHDSFPTHTFCIAEYTIKKKT